MMSREMNDGPTWWLDELAHAGDEHLDTAYVAGYEAKAGYDPVDDVTALVRHGLGRASTVIDIGAGTGRFSIEIAKHCAQVIAVDVSPAMVAVMRERASEAEVGNMTVVEAGWLSYDHVDDPVDFVFTRNALHQIPDFWKGVALARVATMLEPGGILRLRDLVFDFEPSDAPERMAAWFAGAVDDSAKGWTADELAEHVRLEYSTYTWLFEPMLERTGFEILEREVVRGVYAAYTCRRSLA
jgi:ubiquinone/menaquinone biosynthesis C-methylase UbiE